MRGSTRNGPSRASHIESGCSPCSAVSGNGAWCKGSMRVCRTRGERSTRSAPIRTQGNGGDSIPDETDGGDPAPPALAPRRHSGRVARPPVVAPPARVALGPLAQRSRESGETPSGPWCNLAAPVPWKHDVAVQIGWGPLSRSPSTVGPLAFNQTCVGSNPAASTGAVAQPRERPIEDRLIPV